MKKVLFFAVAAFSFISANAQESTVEGFSKGDILTSLSFSYAKEKANNNETEYTNSSVSPSISYFVTDNIAVDLGLSIDQAKYSASQKESSVLYGAGARYFFNPKNKFSTNLGFDVNLFSTKGNYNVDGDFDADLKAKGTQVNLVYGLNYFISNHFALSLNLSGVKFQSSKTDGFDKNDTSTSFRLNMEALNFGLVYKL